MIVLAIDTCEPRGSVAILNDDAILQVVAHTSTEEYSSWLLPAVDLALKSAKTTLAEVDVFAAASGPGSFTGVRIGLTTVKAWSEVFNRPIVAVSRLEAVAAQSHSKAPYVASLIDAQRGQIFGALYKRSAGELTLIDQEMVASPDVFLDWVDQQVAGVDQQVAGNDQQVAGNEVAWISMDPDALGTHSSWQGRAARGEIQLVPPPLAPLIGKIAFQRASQGHVLDALSVDANYVRRSYVEVLQKGPAHVPGK
jgi:tRNA threonylcarbamoyl adenosine modification protein YeaZ